MKYIVLKREVWVQPIEVEADSEPEAIEAVRFGAKGDYLDDGLEYSHDLGTNMWTVEIKEKAKT